MNTQRGRPLLDPVGGFQVFVFISMGHQFYLQPDIQKKKLPRSYDDQGLSTQDTAMGKEE